MNFEFTKIWKEVVVAYLMVLPICSGDSEENHEAPSEIRMRRAFYLAY
jgi:hypothetical protein